MRVGESAAVSVVTTASAEASSEAARRTMKRDTIGILHLPARASAWAGSTATSGSIAYQFNSGRLWSLASSACATSAAEIGQRASSGSRWSAEQRASRTTGDESSAASER